MHKSNSPAAWLKRGKSSVAKALGAKKAIGWLAPVMMGAMFLTATPGMSEDRGRSDQDGTSHDLTSPSRSEQGSSPIIGGGIRNPPDIGAAGTGTVQDPLRTESPTDEPSIIPPLSPMGDQSDPIESTLPKEPMGKPDIFHEEKPELDPEPGLNR